MLNTPQLVGLIPSISGANSVEHMCNNVSINALEASNNESTSQNNVVIDMPYINVKIHGQEYSCLLDSGATSSVCQEQVFLEIKSRVSNLAVMSVCSLYCTSALGRRRQKIRYQCILPIQIGGKTYEVLFLVVPSLSVGLIVGCSAFIEWQASLDFRELRLVINGSEGVVPLPGQPDPQI